MAVYNVHGGHSLKCRGAAKYLDEVNEDRRVKNKVIELLKNAGHTVYDCTDDTGTTQNANLSSIVSKCNAHTADLDISIHLNAGGGTGVEVWNYDSRTKEVSDRICQRIASALGIANRGTKYSKELYVLRNTKSPALLVECCFVDSKTDQAKWNAERCAQAIAEGILNKTVSGGNGQSQPSKPSVPSSAKPSAPASKPAVRIDVVHQGNAKGAGWQSEVTNYNNTNSNGYSGWMGKELVAFRAKTKGNAAQAGYLEYRAHKKGGGWYGWRRDYNKDNAGDTFAGDGKSAIDGLQFRIAGVSGKHVKYRAHAIGKGWLDWVTDYNDTSDGYAGWYGYAIDAVQIYIV